MVGGYVGCRGVDCHCLDAVDGKVDRAVAHTQAEDVGIAVHIAGIVELAVFGVDGVDHIPVTLVVGFENYVVIFRKAFDRAVQMPFRAVVGA